MNGSGHKFAGLGQRSLLAAVAAACAAASSASANNGLSLTGFGTESVGMGGADVAVARDTSAINTNPAGLTRLGRSAFDGYFTSAFAIDIAHADRFGNDAQVDNSPLLLGGFGYAQPLGPALTVGVGLFAQGGTGNQFRALYTPFGGQDELSALFAIARLSPGLAWQATDRLSLGLAVPVTAARAKQRVFPSVSVLNPTDPSQSFFGSVTNDLSSVRLGVRAGLQYAATPELTLGAVYGSRTKLPLSGGQADVNLAALGLGTVHYGDVRLNGLGLPQEVGAGLAWQVTPRTLVAFDVTWYDWSGVLKTQTYTARDPDTPLAPAELQQTTRLDWKDQYVFALGVAHEATPAVTVYGGLNYGRNPIPNARTSALLSATGERHVTGGMRYRIDPAWSVSASLEYLLPIKVTYDNPELPFGPGTESRNSYLALTLMVSRRW